MFDEFVVIVGIEPLFGVVVVLFLRDLPYRESKQY